MTIDSLLAQARPLATRRNALLLAVLVAFGLRIVKLDAQSLWYDEAFSAWLSAKPFAEITARTAADIHPPLYYYLLAIWMPFAGQSEFSLRFLSLCAGVAAEPVVFLLARRLLGEIGAFVALSLAVASPMYVWYSQEARMYMLLVLLVTASAYAFWRWLDKPTWSLWLVWVALSIASIYLHFYAAFVLAAQVAYFFYWWVRQETRWSILLAALGGAAVVGIAFLPWARFALTRLSEDDSYFEGALQLWEVLRKTAIMFATGHTVLESEALVPALVFGVLALLGWVAAPRLRPDSMNLGQEMPFRAPFATGIAARVYLVLWLVLPIVLLWLVSYGRPKFHPRYLLIASPAFLLLVSAALAELGRSFWRSQRGAAASRYAWIALASGFAAVVASASISGLINLYTDPRFSKDDFRSAIRTIQENRTPDEVTVLVSGHMFPVYEYYDPGGRYVALPDSPTLSATRVLGFNSANDLNARLRGATGAWLLLWQDDVVDPGQFVRTILDTQAERTDATSFWGLDLLRYRIAPGTVFSDKPRVAVSLDTSFGGEVALLGYNPPPQPRPADQGIELTLFWRALRDLDRDYKVQLRAFDSGGHEVGALDARPANYNFPTTRWRSGDVVFGNLVVPLNPGTPPGSYRIEVAMYAENDPAPLEVRDASSNPAGRVVGLQPVRVERAAVPPPLESLKPARKMRYSIAGAIDLMGYDLDRVRAQPGEPIQITLYWRATAAPKEDYRLLFTIARSASPTDSFTGNNPVPLGEDYPTSQWRSGEVVKATYAFHIPGDAADGDRAFRLSVLDKGGKAVGAPISLGTIAVEPSTRNFRPPPQLSVVDNVRFGSGELLLYGYDVIPTPVMRSTVSGTVGLAAGEPLRLVLWWRSVQQVRDDYKVFVHLVPDGAPLIAQHDGVPAAGTRPTLSWVPGEYLADPHELRVPPGTRPGFYALEVGLYNARTNQRLPVQGPSPQASAARLGVRVQVR